VVQFVPQGIINGKQAGEAKEVQCTDFYCSQPLSPQLTLQFLSQQIAAAQFDVGALVAKYPFVESGLTPAACFTLKQVVCIQLLGEKGEITWKELGKQGLSGACINCAGLMQILTQPS